MDVLNALTGNLDREGGAMFPTPAAGARNTQGAPGRGSGIKIGPKRSRVRGLPQIFGELPAVCLAEEMLTPGEGVKADQTNFAVIDRIWNLWRLKILPTLAK